MGIGFFGALAEIWSLNEASTMVIDALAPSVVGISSHGIDNEK